MKEISELNFPEDLKYAEDHEWVKDDNGEVTIGISDYAQDQLGDIVFVQLGFDLVSTWKKVECLWNPVRTQDSVLPVHEVQDSRHSQNRSYSITIRISMGCNENVVRPID